MEKPLEDFIKIVLSVSRLVGENTGIDPLLSRSIYDYDVVDPGWNWKEIDRAVSSLRKNLSNLAPGQVDFIGDFLQSFEVMVREGIGEAVPYRERVQAYLQVSADLIAEEEIDALQASLEQKLTEAGYNQDLPAAYLDWCKSQRIANEELHEYWPADIGRWRDGRPTCASWKIRLSMKSS